MDFPKMLLLFSGKRKSGKDFICENLHKKLGTEKSAIVRISSPLKGLYAKEHNLDFLELLASGPYKEKYRQDMIVWSDQIRAKDPSYFCRKSCLAAPLKNIWIVSDIRRKTDIMYFRKTYGDKVKTIRISCDLEIRKSRGYVFTEGIDDGISECGLDDFNEWDLKVSNNNLEEYQNSLEVIFKLVEECM